MCFSFSFILNNSVVLFDCDASVIVFQVVPIPSSFSCKNTKMKGTEKELSK